jgi:uncharacterized protein YidB (DUF937 family)
MGLFDSLEKMAMDQFAQQGPDFLHQALANTPLGGASGLIDQLVQGGLGPEVAAMASGQPGAGVSPDMLKSVLDASHVQQLAGQFGIEPDQVLGLISQHLPALAQQQAG